MKLAIVSNWFPISSEAAAGSFAYGEARRLSRRNIEIHIVRFASGKDVCVDNMFVYNAIEFGFSTVFFGIENAFVFPRSFFFHPRHVAGFSIFGKKIASVVTRNSIDVIHAHFAYPFGFAALLAKEATNKPLVVTLHGADILIESSIDYGVRLRRWIDEAVKRVLQTADKVVVASKCVYEQALNVGCLENKLVYIPNGVDITRFNPSLDGSEIRKKLRIEGNPIVFAIRRHVPKNGLEYLIRAIPLVTRRLPNVMFLIGGHGPLRSYHEFLVRKLGVSRNVIFTGYIPHNEVPNYYAACDVSVIPSIIEAFGVVAVEAMACGKPVVGSNVGGIAEVIEDGIDGLLAKPKDPKDLAEKILCLFENPDMMKKMGMNGREIVIQRFDVDKRIEKMIKLYLDLMRV